MNNFDKFKVTGANHQPSSRNQGKFRVFSHQFNSLIDAIASGVLGGGSSWGAHVEPNGGGVDGIIHSSEGIIPVEISSSSLENGIPTGTVTVDRSGYLGSIDVVISGDNFESISFTLDPTQSQAAWVITKENFSGSVNVLFTDEEDSSVDYDLTYASGQGEVVARGIRNDVGTLANYYVNQEAIDLATSWSVDDQGTPPKEGLYTTMYGGNWRDGRRYLMDINAQGGIDSFLYLNELYSADLASTTFAYSASEPTTWGMGVTMYSDSELNAVIADGTYIYFNGNTFIEIVVASGQITSDLSKGFLTNNVIRVSDTTSLQVTFEMSAQEAPEVGTKLHNGYGIGEALADGAYVIPMYFASEGARFSTTAIVTVTGGSISSFNGVYVWSTEPATSPIYGQVPELQEGILLYSDSVFSSLLADGDYEIWDRYETTMVITIVSGEVMSITAKVTQ